MQTNIDPLVAPPRPSLSVPDNALDSETTGASRFGATSTAGADSPATAEIPRFQQRGSFRFILGIALRKAQLAVMEDEREHFVRARKTYTEAIDMLSLVIDHVGATDQKRERLVHLRQTYQDRIRGIDATLATQGLDPLAQGMDDTLGAMDRSMARAKSYETLATMVPPSTAELPEPPSILRRNPSSSSVSSPRMPQNQPAPPVVPARPTLISRTRSTHQPSLSPTMGPRPTVPTRKPDVVQLAQANRVGTPPPPGTANALIAPPRPDLVDATAAHAVGPRLRSHKSLGDIWAPRSSLSLPTTPDQPNSGWSAPPNVAPENPEPAPHPPTVNTPVSSKHAHSPLPVVDENTPETHSLNVAQPGRAKAITPRRPSPRRHPLSVTEYADRWLQAMPPAVPKATRARTSSLSFQTKPRNPAAVPDRVRLLSTEERQQATRTTGRGRTRAYSQIVNPQAAASLVANQPPVSQFTRQPDQPTQGPNGHWNHRADAPTFAEQSLGAISELARRPSKRLPIPPTTGVYSASPPRAPLSPTTIAFPLSYPPSPSAPTRTRPPVQALFSSTPPSDAQPTPTYAEKPLTDGPLEPTQDAGPAGEGRSTERSVGAAAPKPALTRLAQLPHPALRSKSTGPTDRPDRHFSTNKSHRTPSVLAAHPPGGWRNTAMSSGVSSPALSPTLSHPGNAHAPASMLQLLHPVHHPVPPPLRSPMSIHSTMTTTTLAVGDGVGAYSTPLSLSAGSGSVSASGRADGQPYQPPTLHHVIMEEPDYTEGRQGIPTTWLISYESARARRRSSSTVRPMRVPSHSELPPHFSPWTVDLQPYWLLRCLSQSIQTGGWVTQQLYIPKRIWYQAGARLTAVEHKINACEILVGAMHRMVHYVGARPRSTPKDADPAAATDPLSHPLDNLDWVLGELTAFESVVHEVQDLLAKKVNVVPPPKKSGPSNSAKHAPAHHAGAPSTPRPMFHFADPTTGWNHSTVSLTTATSPKGSYLATDTAGMATEDLSVATSPGYSTVHGHNLVSHSPGLTTNGLAPSVAGIVVPPLPDVAPTLPITMASGPGSFSQSSSPPPSGSALSAGGAFKALGKRMTKGLDRIQATYTRDQKVTDPSHYVQAIARLCLALQTLEGWSRYFSGWWTIVCQSSAFRSGPLSPPHNASYGHSSGDNPSPAPGSGNGGGWMFSPHAPADKSDGAASSGGSGTTGVRSDTESIAGSDERYSTIPTGSSPRSPAVLATHRNLSLARRPSLAESLGSGKSGYHGWPKLVPLASLQTIPWPWFAGNAQHQQIVARLNRIAEFLQTVVCAFILHDLQVLMAKYMKRLREWMLE
ncbi:hypothetical protein H4R34_000189 [Dimargaris verticillata]|uniref:MIT domain-containing protein n=1 Tax=Dimargaris verticillata TaxID=2761393 RepID=A0A9W8BC91_9FUNG|nr:hypothetical protein H4R34_000189 [Dimargaris verticillata]